MHKNAKTNKDHKNKRPETVKYYRLTNLRLTLVCWTRWLDTIPKEWVGHELSIYQEADIFMGWWVTAHMHVHWVLPILPCWSSFHHCYSICIEVNFIGEHQRKMLIPDI